MITRHAIRNSTWIDVLSPTADEMRAVLKECDVPAEFAHDLMAMTPHTEARRTRDAVKITLDFPIVKRTDINHPHEIKFIATKTHLLTIHFEDIEAIHRFAKEFEVISILKRAGSRANTGHVFLALLSCLYEGLGSKLDYLEARMHAIENEMFNDNEREILVDISQVGRRLISFQQAISAHRGALSDLGAAVDAVFGKLHAETVAHIMLTYGTLTRRTEALVRTLEILRDTDNALLAAKQNEIMKTLTIMAFITYPLTLFTSMFGMNTDSAPILGSRYDFWIIIGIMSIVTVGFFSYFKYRKWL